ncbi:MAG: ABC transporter permease [Gemmatimonadota bacterium]|nr:ABC transporter permease [Gemmatimonadota bacterium]
MSLITLIATAGVAVGVMALIVVLGVMTGLQHELRAKILIASPHLRVHTYGDGLRVDGWREAIDVIRTNPEVVAAAPFVISMGLIRAGADFDHYSYIIGVDPDTGSVAATDLPRHFLSGDLTFATDGVAVDGGLVLGKRLAERLIVFEGEEVSVVSSAGTKFNAAVGGFIPMFWSFEVSGRFETGMFEYDNNYAVTSLEVGQRFAGLGDAVSGIDVRLTDPELAPVVAQELTDSLGYPYRTVTWQDQNRELFSALKLEKLGMGLVLVLVIMVAAFNIVGTLTMVVTDKTREIGILRAMGMPAGMIRNAFIFQGLMIGSVGTAVGASLGVVLAKLLNDGRLIPINASVYFIDHLPVRVELVDFGTIVVAGIVVAILATIYPARRAADLVPVEAIRHE